MHPAGAIERAGDDLDDPSEPLGDQAVPAHHHTGAGHRRQPRAGVADGGEQLAQGPRIQPADGGDPLQRERLHGRPQPLHVVGIGRRRELGLVGPLTQQFPHQPGEDFVVCSRPKLQVTVGERGRLRPTRVENPDLTAGPAEVPQSHDRVGQGRPVPVGDDGIGPEQHQQARLRWIPTRSECGSGDEFGGEKDWGVVDLSRPHTPAVAASTGSSSALRPSGQAELSCPRVSTRGCDGQTRCEHRAWCTYLPVSSHGQRRWSMRVAPLTGQARRTGMARRS